jgi:hypothetical protein
MIEALGVPHTEVELILVNGESSPFERIVCDGDRIAVYPNSNRSISRRCYVSASNRCAKSASWRTPISAAWRICCA